ncbi:hypothetical protein BDY19DRAFT_1039110 [Irpex rosettiformis]|uniref:Uncharacterized protein n=1 Tax=Irpex rosettiformis TaxID=378272 RepID=A0ACB8ULG4_9APHY|nr:hypothetical protein BDY19DRAFT_1039110 [Irpex rosettiformis]
MQPSVNGTASGSEQPKQRRKPGRVPVSCAECRRLKLRCDRQVPCEKCVKRGCAAICPDGALTTGNKMNRLAFADAEELQKKVERLRGRVHELEDALRTLQSNISDNPHPLLTGSPAVASVTNSPVPPNDSSSSAPPCKDDEEFIDAFGTLTLGLRGESRFFGPTSRSEYLIHAPRGYSKPPCKIEDMPRLTQAMLEESMKQLESECDDPEIKRQALQALPSLSEACRLCEIFLEHGEYLWEAIPRTQLYDEILSVIYRSPHSGNPLCQTSSHAAALLFIIFALATAMDPKSEPYTLQALEYYLLSRLCLRFDSPVYETTLWGIQTCIYETIFLQLYDKEPAHTASHKAWILNGFSIKLGVSIGLHVKSSKWQLDEEASNRRSHVFWQLFHKDAWLSFGFGRPPCLSLTFVDCDFPKDPEEKMDAEGKRDWGYHPWTWQYAKLLHHVMTTVCGAKAPQYATVLDLDRKIRDFPVPYRLVSRCDVPERCNEIGTTIHVQRWMVVSSKEITLLNLHRPYLAQVLSSTPHDLLKHRYSPSVIAIYRASWRLIEGLIATHKKAPLVFERISLPWSHALSAAIVMCLFVTRAPTSSLASASLHELDRVCEIFEKLQYSSIIARNNLEAVRKMQRQAHDAISQLNAHDKSHPGFTELDRIGGKTQLIATATVSTPSPNSPSTASTPDSTYTSTGTTSSIPSSLYDQPSNGVSIINGAEMHPILISDMRTFEGFSTNPVGSSATVPMEFDFDLSQAFPLPLPGENPPPPDLQPHFQDMSGYLGVDFFATGGAGGVNTMSVNNNVMLQDPSFDDIPNSMGGMNVSVPELHATWQSFVEQLGFKF